MINGKVKSEHLLFWEKHLSQVVGGGQEISNILDSTEKKIFLISNVWKDDWFHSSSRRNAELALCRCTQISELQKIHLISKAKSSMKVCSYKTVFTWTSLDDLLEKNKLWVPFCKAEWNESTVRQYLYQKLWAQLHIWIKNMDHRVQSFVKIHNSADWLTDWCRWYPISIISKSVISHFSTKHSVLNPSMPWQLQILLRFEPRALDCELWRICHKWC